MAKKYIRQLLKKLRTLLQDLKNWLKVAYHIGFLSGVSSRQIAVLWGFNRWKRGVVENFLPEYKIIFSDEYCKGASGKGALDDIQRKKFDELKNPVFIVWSYNMSPEIEEYAVMRDIPIYRMEDGFIRSADLGCVHSLPMSLVLDKKGIYFDASRASDLEDILNFYPFRQNLLLMEIACRLLSTMRALKVSKYNIGTLAEPRCYLGPKKKFRILVVGQVESDASLTYGLAAGWTNLDLIRKAYDDHPEAEIIYRPHPDVIHTNREESVRPGRPSFYKVFSDNVILADLFREVDHVYTLTSLSGFEALIYNLKVTVIGMPFYAGWGLTEDLQLAERRNRELTLEELFCGAYILYPRYLLNLDSPALGCLQTMCQTVAPQLDVGHDLFGGNRVSRK